MREYGIFNDEGCVERGIYAPLAATQALARIGADDPWAYADEMCPDHEEQPASHCEECAADEEEVED